MSQASERCCQEDMGVDLSATLNADCACTSTTAEALGTAILGMAGNHPVLQNLPATHPHLFSTTPVFVSHQDFAEMESAVGALEATIDRPEFQQLALENAPESAGFAPGPHGVFMGYDFHLSPDGPKLIEINTNAGGAFLNEALYRAQHLCCTFLSEAGIGGGITSNFSTSIINMLKAEWQAQGRDGQPKTLAIVDTLPADQYLFPEFILAQKMLNDAGIKTIIVDPSELKLVEGVLVHEDLEVEFVYNRLVDFYLDAPEHIDLKDAYLSGAVVVTPSPRHHALYAQKANLQILSSPTSLTDMGCDAETIDILGRAVPATERVSMDKADDLWAARKSLFFKPEAGHGGKAVYRGDKLTKSVWQNVIAGPYVAQKAISPALRTTRHGDETTIFKSDIRLYTYRGKVLLAAARLYRGQTTNFRTPGGGFAPVYVL